MGRIWCHHFCLQCIRLVKNSRFPQSNPPPLSFYLTTTIFYDWPVIIFICLSWVFSCIFALFMESKLKMQKKKFYQIVHPSKESKTQVYCRKLFPLFSAIKLCILHCNWCSWSIFSLSSFEFWCIEFFGTFRNWCPSLVQIIWFHVMQKTCQYTMRSYTFVQAYIGNILYVFFSTASRPIQIQQEWNIRCHWIIKRRQFIWC
jgi:hypothetical protein